MGITNIRNLKTDEERKTANALAQKKYRRTYSGTIQGKYFTTKRRARDDGLSFSITIEFLHKLWEKQNGHCALTGVKLGFIGSGWCAASIDRINPDLGYTPSNVQWTVWRVNDAKSAMTNEDFINMCKAIAVYSSVKDIERAETILRRSTLEAIASGSAEHPEMDDDIVHSELENSAD